MTYDLRPARGETFKLQVRYYADLAGHKVKLQLINSHTVDFESPSRAVTVDGDIITLKLSTSEIEAVQPKVIRYRLVVIDLNEEEGLGDEIIMSGKVIVSE